MRVPIVGAGPTGAALSLLLTRHGIDVTVFEKEDDLGREFRGEAPFAPGPRLYSRQEDSVSASPIL